MRNTICRGRPPAWIAAGFIALALPAAPVAWAGESGCAPNIPAGVALRGVYVVGEPVVPAPPGALKVVDTLILEDGRVLPDGEDVPLGQPISNGVMVNASADTLLLAFSDDTTLLLAPGQAVGAGEAACRCRCTCKDAGGATKTALFNCSSNQDKCEYNGEACAWADGGGVHEGTYSDCKKIWVIR